MNLIIFLMFTVFAGAMVGLPVIVILIAVTTAYAHLAI